MKKGPILLLLLVLTIIYSQALAQTVKQRPPVKCSENSPERRGEEGCTILATKPLLGSLTKAQYWHLDRFDSLEDAKKAAGPNSVAAQAHGSFWLMSVEEKEEDHHGGRHVTWIGPLTLPASARITMRVQSTLLLPGGLTPIHTHSGPEMFFVVAGEQCLEFSESSQRLSAGQSYIIPTDVIHRGIVSGSEARRALVLVLHDSDRPGSHDLADSTPLIPCK
jgi:quercetin dioxygenase-like cupin family protein